MGTEMDSFPAGSRALDAAAIEGGLALGSAEDGAFQDVPLRAVPAEEPGHVASPPTPTQPTLAQPAQHEDSIFPPVTPPAVIGTPLQPPSACGGP